LKFRAEKVNRENSRPDFGFENGTCRQPKKCVETTGTTQDRDNHLYFGPLTKKFIRAYVLLVGKNFTEIWLMMYS